MDKFPTSSRLGNTCWRSYPNADENRDNKDPGSAADIGTRIHSVISDTILEHDRYSRELARGFAVKSGVFAEWSMIDHDSVERFFFDKPSAIHVELPLCVGFNENGEFVLNIEYKDRDKSASWIYGGTLDLGIVDNGGSHGTVIDWKTGYNRYDRVDVNSQMLSLAHAFGWWTGLDTVTPVLAYLNLGVVEIGSPVVVNLKQYCSDLLDEMQKEVPSASNCQYCDKRRGCKSYYEFSKGLVGSI